MEFNLSKDETLELQALIQERLNELSEEIHHADSAPFRDQLKKRKSVLEGLLKRLAGEPQIAGAKR